MPRRPTWEDADLLLRIDEIASRPQMRESLDWFHATQFAAASRIGSEIAKDAPEYQHLHRFVGFFELVGVLVRFGLLSEQLALETWNVWGPWTVFDLTIQRERAVSGPEFAENFQWLASRQKARMTARARSPARRTRKSSA